MITGARRSCKPEDGFRLPDGPPIFSDPPTVGEAAVNRPIRVRVLVREPNMRRSYRGQVRRSLTAESGDRYPVVAPIGHVARLDEHLITNQADAGSTPAVVAKLQGEARVEEYRPWKLDAGGRNSAP